MSVSSVKHNTAVSLHEIKQERAKLNEFKQVLLQKISGIKNTVIEIKKSITEHQKNISKNQSLLKNIETVAEKHGKNTTVRLKNDHFKYGQASNFFKNMFHSGRYQSEREAAVNKINAGGVAVSAGEVMKTLSTRIDSDLSKVDDLKKEVDANNQLIDKLETKQYGAEDKIRDLSKIVAAEKKASENKNKGLQNFSMIYQSNAGCRALNREARHQFGNSASAGELKGSKIIEEYRNAHGYEIFSRGNKALESTIKANCSNLSELVKTSAKAWYTPGEKNITTYRGQGMTQRGFDALLSQFNADKRDNTETVYNLGQFFSTSSRLDVAKDFAYRSGDDVKVIFKVKGNSSNGLSIPGGLAFENDEGEKLYSPLANFKVTAMSTGLANTFNVVLEEVTKTDNAPLLPY